MKSKQLQADMLFSVTHTNPRVFTVASLTERLFSVTHTNPRVFTVASLTERLFSVTHTNPRVFTVAVPECLLNVSSVLVGSEHYAPGGSISFIAQFNNLAAKGFDDILWELIDDEDTVLDSGTEKSLFIQGMGSGSVSVSGVVAPSEYSELRVRAMGSGDTEWFYSSIFYILPVDLSVTATLAGSDIFWPGTPVECSVSLLNAGYSGSQTIEWQMIDDEETVLDSGTQSSGTIGDFGTALVELDDIWSPSGGDILFKIRARIQGSSNWVLSMQCANYMWITPPPNPEPRG